MAANFVRYVCGVSLSVGRVKLLGSASLVPRTLGTSQVRGYKNWYSKYRKHIYYSKKERGPVDPVPRSTWLEWNYDAELFAFGKRLGENFEANLLKRALTNKSYLEAEYARRQQLGVEESTSAGSEDNQELVQKGRSFVSAYLLRFLRAAYPALPEEGIRGLNAFLMSDETLAHVSSHLGVTDLVLSADFPPKASTLADTLLAIISALDGGEEVKEKFVRDFITTQLCGRNVLEIWNPSDPKKLVSEILNIQGKSTPEPRLLRQSGPGTMEANYVVGVYCDRVLLGHGSGETVSIAENSAFVDVLGRMFRVEESRSPLDLSASPISLNEGVKKEEAVA